MGVNVDLRLGDCLEIMRSLPDGCASLAVVDGPYNMRKADWDKFPSWQAFREFYLPLWKHLGRVLRDNCSLYVFGTFEGLAALKQDLDELGGGWAYRAHVVWHKIDARPQCGWRSQRTFPPMTEDILVYTREHGGVGPGALIAIAREKAGLKQTDIDIRLGYVRSGDPTRGTELCRRWEEGSSVPSEEDFVAAMRICGASGGYDELLEEYQSARYVFNPAANTSNVWAAPQCGAGERLRLGNGDTAHVAQKPLEIIRRIIRASSNPGDVVIDPFCGVGTTAVACAELGRDCIGIEIDPEYFAIAERRIAEAQRNFQPQLLTADA
jgi:adenine-specific DNA-methyltransferase